MVEEEEEEEQEEQQEQQEEERASELTRDSRTKTDRWMRRWRDWMRHSCGAPQCIADRRPGCQCTTWTSRRPGLRLSPTGAAKAVLARRGALRRLTTAAA